MCIVNPVRSVSPRLARAGMSALLTAVVAVGVLVAIPSPGALAAPSAPAGNAASPTRPNPIAPSAGQGARIQSTKPANNVLTGLSGPTGVVAMDNGDVYFVENHASNLSVLKKGSSTPTVALGGLNNASWISRDKSGTIYIPEYDKITSWKPGAAAPKVLVSGLAYASGVAVDNKGAVYFSEFSGGTIKKLAKGATVPTTLLSGLSRPNGVVVDAQGNLFYLENGAGRLMRLASGTTSPTQLVGDIAFGTGLAIGPAGDLYFADASAGKVRVLPKGANAAPDLVWGLTNPDGLALDKAGNLYVTDVVAGTLAKVDAGATPFVSGYVALGDSYSSGEGTGDYYADTDTDGNRCHRSDHAYGPIVASRLSQPINFVACSGAVSFDLISLNHAYNQLRPQIEALSPDTKTVSFSIGGNDAGFADAIFSCVRVVNDCDKDADLEKLIKSRISALAGKNQAKTPDGSDIVPIAKLIDIVHARAPYAKVIVVGYPRIFGTNRDNFSNKKFCAPGAAILFTEAQWLKGLQEKLNAALSTGVNAAKSKGIATVFVNPTNKFDGHSLCDRSNSWIKTLFVGDSGSAHPTSEGQSAYADLVEAQAKG